MPLQSQEMRARVLNALYWDLAVPRDGLNVDVENGWVTISGMVDLPLSAKLRRVRREKRSGRDRRHQPDPSRGPDRIGAKPSVIRRSHALGATTAAQTDFNIPPST